MKQVKMFASDKKANKWLKENKDKEIMNITFDAGYFAIIYEEAMKQVKKPKK
jgi:ABC-type thiamine transport system substrate-binding protein